MRINGSKEDLSHEGGGLRVTARRKTADIPDGLGASGRSGECDEQAPPGIVLPRDGLEHPVIKI